MGRSLLPLLPLLPSRRPQLIPHSINTICIKNDLLKSCFKGPSNP
jgi:hypothetical protein